MNIMPLAGLVLDPHPFVNWGSLMLALQEFAIKLSDTCSEGVRKMEWCEQICSESFAILSSYLQWFDWASDTVEVQVCSECLAECFIHVCLND